MADRRRRFKRLTQVFFNRTLIPVMMMLALAPVPAAANIDLGAIRPELRPAPPPPSPYISEEDYALLDAAFEAVREEDWPEALAFAGQVSDPVGRDLVLWLWVQDNDSEAPFEAIVDFMNTHPDWPRQDTILRRAEEAMPRTMAPDQVIAWFAGNEPISGWGKLRLADAYIAHGNRQFARHWIQRAWIEHDFTSADQDDVLREYREFLDEDTHIERAERLMWEHQYYPARRMREYVSDEFRTLMDAWLALMTLDSSASSRVEAVAEEYRDHPGLLYERIRWRRRKGRDEDAWPMLAEAPTTAEGMGRPERWWDERHIQARNALREGEYELAYQMVQGNGMSSGGDFAEAEWLAGFIALRFLDNPEAARDHFQRLADGVSYPISLARGHYWLGRALDELGEEEAALAAYREAAENPTTYYGQLAMEHLPEPPILRLPHGPQPSESRRLTLRSTELVHAAEVLSAVASERLQFSWFVHLAETYEDPHDLQIIADLARELDQWHMGVRVGKIAMYSHIYLTETTYPLIEYEDMEADIPLPEMALVLGLSRQESEFNPRAVSHAGARGLMQLMPATARATARNLEVDYSTSWLTDLPSYNTELGRYHLGELLSRFDGSYIMTIAAYNAGAHRVDRWVSEYGDPRTDEVDPIDWVELISFRETRNYVQRVLENTMVYRNRLTGADLEVTMSQDLSRARGQAPVMFATVPDMPIPTTPVATASALDVTLHLDALVRGLSSSPRAAELEDLPSPIPAPTRAAVGERVVLTLSPEDRGPLIDPRVRPEDTLQEPATQIWSEEN